MLDLCEDEDNMVSLRDKLTKKFCSQGLFSLAHKHKPTYTEAVKRW